jgi:hypothetical protein
MDFNLRDKFYEQDILHVSCEGKVHKCELQTECYSIKTQYWLLLIFEHETDREAP